MPGDPSISKHVQGKPLEIFTHKDLQPKGDVRWCPGCGDYAILAAVQRLLPSLGVNREDTVFISGIGCAARFPYYMETYGMHSIHGRAPTVATGLKAARPELDVWVITGDGDSLSIGGNHTLHALRRNVNMKILLFNNRIYGLTKGQYSPLSRAGKVSKSTPSGSLDHPVSPLRFALGADATFVARVLDTDIKMITEVLKDAHKHKGTSYVEILQNCVVFNDGEFSSISDKKTRDHNQLVLKNGEPLIFDKGKKGVCFDRVTMTPFVIDLEQYPDRRNDVIVHNVDDPHGFMALVYSQMEPPDLPTPVGVFRRHNRPAYDEQIKQQGEEAMKKPRPSLRELLLGKEVWEIS